MSTPTDTSYDTRVIPRKVPAGPPLNWISAAVRLLRSNWGVILPAYLLVFLVPALIQYGAMEMISGGSVFGTVVLVIVSIFVTLLLNAGMVALFHSAAEGTPRFTQVFSGFSGHTILHTFLMVVMMIVVGIVLSVIGYVIASIADFSFSSVSRYGMGGFMDGGFGPSAGIAAILLMFIAVLCALVLFGALFFYAIPLIVVARQGVLEAVRNSLRACFKNLFVLLFFAVNAMVVTQLVLFPTFAIGASTASVIGMTVITIVVSFVWGAVLAGAYYLSFRDILLGKGDTDSAKDIEATVPA
ncbi:hypothetical protein LL254_05645 [Marinobacter nauticus]|uniref:hypothetical protein n=1 Tax=Marinobacter nauticus TaxID=2743 RepID=UPI001D17EE37|nr:hypothetical protein [Marinobacter nauticus]MCC4270185.1 hypothetical protein [Marinobacter nauticus]